MTRRLVRFALPLTTLFALAAALIGARVYNATAFRALLVDETCPAPCFLGIRPNVTTQEDAINILENHPWIDDVLLTVGGHTRAAITWQWNGTQPDWLPGERTGLIQAQAGLVREIFVQTDLTFGEVWLSFGQPQDTRIYRVYNPASLQYLASYESQSIQFRGDPGCPLNTADFWNAQQAVRLPAMQTDYMIEVGSYDWFALNRQLCSP